MKQVLCAVVLAVVVFTECYALTCGTNEEVNSCIDALCGPVNCSQRDVPPYCPASSTPCREGCACKAGFLREDSTGQCVQKSQCQSEKVKTCDPKTEDWGCTNAQCKPEFCSEKNNGQLCPGVAGPCIEGCVCLEGYLKNDSTGKCVPADEC